MTSREYRDDLRVLKHLTDCPDTFNSAKRHYRVLLAIYPSHEAFRDTVHFIEAMASIKYSHQSNSKVPTANELR